MSWYELLLFVHIAGAIVWIGGGTVLQFFGILATRAGGDRAVVFAQDVEWIGMRVLTPSSLLTFVSGVLLVVDGPWSFSEDWVVLGLVLFGATFFAGFGFFGPESGRIARLAVEHGFESSQVQARLSRLIMLTRLDLVLLFLIVFDMAVKPQFVDAALVWGIGGAVVAAAIVIRRSLLVRGMLAPARAPAE